jgi:hypothetical protein
MTEKRPTPQESAVKDGRKRAAPTIDLTATDLTPAENNRDAEAAPTHTSRDKSQRLAGQDSSAIWEPPPESSGPAQRGPESVAPEAVTTDSAQINAGSARGGRWVGVVLSGITGAIIVAVLFIGAWLGGLLPAGDGRSTVSPAQRAAPEKQVADLRQRPSAAGGSVGDNATLDALTRRIEKIETSIKAIATGSSSADPALLKRVTDAESAAKAAQAALDSLNRRGDDIAAKAAHAADEAAAANKAVTALRGDLQDVSQTANAGASSTALDQLRRQIDGLERQATSTKDQLATVAAKAAASDSAARLALLVAALRDAVLRGQPYADALAKAKSLGADAELNTNVLAPLAVFAATGLPSKQALAQELSALLPAIAKAASGQKPAGGFFERLQANAEHLVSIRPVGAPPGDDSPAVLARLETAIAKADIAAALAEIGKLPEAARQVTADWVTRAVARQQAVAAAYQFADDAARALGSQFGSK